MIDRIFAEEAVSATTREGRMSDARIPRAMCPAGWRPLGRVVSMDVTFHGWRMLRFPHLPPGAACVWTWPG